MTETQEIPKVIISIPTPLRTFTDGKKKVDSWGNTVTQALNSMIRTYPKLKTHLYNGDDLRSFVNIYLNGEDIRYLVDAENTKITDGDKILIIPSIAGGSL